MKQTTEYHAYEAARDRCLNPKNKHWKDYGGRGIEFRFAGFLGFLAAVGRKPSPELTLDRIDNSGHYETGNLRWATWSEQNLNRRRTGGGRCPRHPAPAPGPGAYVLAEAKRLGTACGCCDDIDDPNGSGPAINTGFCDACNAAGCREQTINQPCAAASGKAGR